ncbi:MAG: hypothetical protein WBP85_08055 [Terracidiphilus sp.]
MRFQIVAILILASSTLAVGEDYSPSKNTIKLEFDVDGHPVACKSLSVELSLGRYHFTLPILDREFVIPQKIFKAYASKRHRYKANLSATVSCDDYKVDMSGLYPVSALPGWWTAGISYPASWFDEASESIVPEAGAWVSYIETECIDCDPGVITWQSHIDVPQAVLERLRKEQPSAGEQRARDIAYALAVFHFEYESNRDRLTKQLNDCLLPGKVPATEDQADFDTCDRHLFGEIANLYWRGDASLLQPLLQVANRDENAVEGSGKFYSDLLDRRTEIALKGIGQLPPHKQHAVCERAVQGDLESDSPKLQRVEANLRAVSSETASDCLKTIEATQSK